MTINADDYIVLEDYPPGPVGLDEWIPTSFGALLKGAYSVDDILSIRDSASMTEMVERWHHPRRWRHRSRADRNRIMRGIAPRAGRGGVAMTYSTAKTYAAGTPICHHGKHIALVVGTAEKAGIEYVRVRPATFDVSQGGAVLVHPAMITRLDGPAVFSHCELLAAAVRREGLSGMRVRL